MTFVLHLSYFLKSETYSYIHLIHGPLQVSVNAVVEVWKYESS